MAKSSRKSASTKTTPTNQVARSAYFNRELSWLAFNRRVLEQAQSNRHPLLERVMFLSIVSSNLDEFFEIRVAGLMQQVDSGISETSIDGLSPQEQLRRIHAIATSLVSDQCDCWQQQVVPALAKENIFIRSTNDLTRSELSWVRTYFEEQVYPVLTPLALDQSHPFPQLGNKTLNIAVSLDNPDTPEDEQLIAILPVPRILPRLVALAPAKSGAQRYVFLSDIIKICAGELFPGYKVNGAYAFRITRNSDLYIEEEETENLLQKIEEELLNLRRGAAVRLEIEADVCYSLFHKLCEQLELSQDYVYRLRGPLNPVRLMSLLDIDRPDLKYAPFVPVNTSVLRDTSKIFSTIRRQDVMLHHPYDAFTPVVDFVEHAARDPKVFAIKQTLYRTSGDSPIVRALIEAARIGKQVTALVELKARFDEANNIQWARQLEEAGVHVVYGLVGHKTHCKLCLVVRREGKRMKHYAHMGTGNYNPKTAKLYTDLSCFTSKAKITNEVAHVFNTLTGFGRSPTFRHLLVAPFNLHRRINELIAQEARNAVAGKPARIIAKMNSLVDKTTIDSLYAASQAGVKIYLIIRGICCLVPGVKGLSENIRVRSVVGRFLEHARIFYFQSSTRAKPLIYAGSADWVTRNFVRRIEVLFHVDDPDARRWIMKELLPTERKDNENSRMLHANGSYLPPPKSESELGFSLHDYFIASALKRADDVKQADDALDLPTANP